MKPVNDSPPSIRSSLNAFFFSEEVPYGAALTRIFLPCAAMAPMLVRFPIVRELYSSDGISLQLFELFGQGEVLPLLPGSVAVALYGLMLFCFMSTIVGWKTRWSLAILTPLYMYFCMLDAVGTITKYSVVASHLMILLTFSNCGAVWSVDSWLARKKQHGPYVPPQFPVWPVRLMQLLFAFCYFGAAVTKIQTESFFTGDQMRYWMLSNWNYENPVGESIAMWSPVLLITSYVAIVWEILFAFLVWRGRGRFILLACGFMFHLMTWLTLGLYVFPVICVSGYFSFVAQRDVSGVRRIIRRLRRRLHIGKKSVRRLCVPEESKRGPLPAGVAWTVLAGLAAVSAAEFEYRADLYGTRSPDGLPALTKVDRNEALRKINNEQPLREKDKFFSFEIGSFTIGGQLANRVREFEYGQKILAQCSLNPPHEDMWVECLLVDDQARIIEQFGQFVTREMIRANFVYQTGNKLVPGNYSLVLHSGGKEIDRRRFRLNGDPNSLPKMMDYLTN